MAVDTPWTKIDSPDHPSLGWEEVRSNGSRFFGCKAFGTTCHSKQYDNGMRRIKLKETLAIVGVDERQEAPLLANEEETRENIHIVVPVKTATSIVHMIHCTITMHKDPRCHRLGPCLSAWWHCIG